MKAFLATCVLIGMLSSWAEASMLPRQGAGCRAHESEDDCRDRVKHPKLPTDARSMYRSQQSGEDTNSFWLQNSRELLRQRRRSVNKKTVAKNLIFFLGDGMGVTTIAAARNLLGGEEQRLSFEELPATGLSKTYAVDKIVPDSANTATAYLCGIKGNYGTVGVNAAVQRHDCDAMADEDHHVHSIAKWALDAGKAAGLITTSRVTHASAAGIYAHTANRDWENDLEIKKSCGADSQLDDIAVQLIHGDVGKRLKVIMGGGKQQFIDSKLFADGERSDGRNLIEEYLSQAAGNVLVENRDELNEVDLNATERLLGLFQNSHMAYHLAGETEQPTLEEMTGKALEFMQQNVEAKENGYFLFIESGLIDNAHHDNKARLALDETVEFSKAVALALRMTSSDDTLIVVTADHSHTLSLAGYHHRGSDIFSVAPKHGDDHKTYTPLNYANGPSFETFYNTEKFERRNPEERQTGDMDDTFPATLPLDSETHSGEDVAVYASGPWSHLFTGVYEQNTIPHMMAYAACIGDGLKTCT